MLTVPLVVYADDGHIHACIEASKDPTWDELSVYTFKFESF
jgi:hypothetical protein